MDKEIMGEDMSASEIKDNLSTGKVFFQRGVHPCDFALKNLFDKMVKLGFIKEEDINR